MQLAGLILQPPAAAKEARASIGKTVEALEKLKAESAFPIEQESAAFSERIGAVVTTFRHETASPREHPAGLSYPPGYLQTLKPGE